jgi:hypothetical protein
VLEWLLIVDEPPTWLGIKIEQRLAGARREREQKLWSQLGSPDALAFRRFRHQVLCGEERDRAGGTAGDPM